jgi:acyl-CoA thioester hydrolase
MFLWRARVYWEDTDGGGIVYYANYLRFLERARTEWLRANGISQRTLAAERDVVFSVVAVEAQYRRPARLDDLLAVSSEPALDGAATLRFRQRIWRESESGELLLTASVRVACLTASTLRPQRLPGFVTEFLRDREG